MAVDLAVYVLADPSHAALVLRSIPGSGYDDGHLEDNVECSVRMDGPWKQEALEKARSGDAEVRPVLEALRQRAVQSLDDLQPMSEDGVIPIGRMPGEQVRALWLADRADLETSMTSMPDGCPAYRYVNRAFVIDAESRSILIGHGHKAGVDVCRLKEVLDAGFGRIAVIIGA